MMIVNDINKAHMLRNRLIEKFYGLAVESYLTRTYLSSLPFDRNEVLSESPRLSNYAKTVISALNPSKLITSAIESASSYSEREFLKGINDSIMEVVTEASERIASEALDNKQPFDETVKKADFTSDEMNKIITATKKDGLGAVEEIVKKKVIDVIKTERDAYKKSEQVKDELKKVIHEDDEDTSDDLDDEDMEGGEEEFSADDDLDYDPESDDITDGIDDVEDSGLESFYRISMSPTDTRQHTSFFSRLQDVCMEAILHTTEEYDEVPYRTLKKITLEATLPVFDKSYKNRDVLQAIDDFCLVTESLAGCEDFCDTEEARHKMKTVAKTAFISTICIMTILEMLYTMHLIKPGINDVKVFVDKPTSVQRIDASTISDIERSLTTAIGSLKKSAALGSLGAVDLESAKESLLTAKDRMLGINTTASNEARIEKMVKSIDLAIASLPAQEAVLLSGDYEPAKTPSYYDNLKNESNAIGFTRAAESLMHNIGSKSIYIELPANAIAEDSKYILDLSARDISSHKVMESAMVLDTSHRIGSPIVDIVKESFGELPQSEHFAIDDVFFYFKDKHYKVCVTDV